jgi:hypothetical protein
MVWKRWVGFFSKRHIIAAPDGEGEGHDPASIFRYSPPRHGPALE